MKHADCNHCRHPTLEPGKKMRVWAPLAVLAEKRFKSPGTWEVVVAEERPSAAHVEVTITPVAEPEHRHECERCHSTVMHAVGCWRYRSVLADECRTCGGGA